MHKLHDLKEMLCRELEEYADHDSLDMGALEVVDKLAHAVKNIDKIISADGTSERMYKRGYSNEYSDGYSRGGRRRDSMGRYVSAGGDVADDLRDLMRNATDENTRRDIQRLIDRM